ncbi:MAG: hypothetical protein H6621_09645 [Halobacteriovoraceae bacterium]|nr:hypothetical protein [Halobacteriovoraceae bacterium]MCB9095320.1 hypothetical protein [Halobacteriovoraceae bacterium]
MFKSLALLSLLFSANIFAETLTMSCWDGEQYSFELTAEIKNIHRPIDIIEFLSDGEELSNVEDLSPAEYYDDGNFKLKIGFGRYSSVEVSLEKCDSTFENSGKGTFNNYVGGFLGTDKIPLTCECSLN